MKRQVNFLDEAEAYRFTLADDEDVTFEISKDTLSFNANSFYGCFFKGIDEKPEYKLLEPPAELNGQAKHVYDTVKVIFKKACESIDEDWFKQPVSDDQSLTDLEKVANQRS